MLTHIPSGLDEIIATFGDCADPDFERTQLASFELPYPLVYTGDAGVASLVHRTRAHRLVVENFQRAFIEIKNAGLEKEATNFGGIYARRSIRGRSAHASAHSWGIAIDLEPRKFPLGSSERMPDAVVEIFRRAGFFYGGDFKSRKDPMHFQLCANY